MKKDTQELLKYLLISIGILFFVLIITALFNKPLEVTEVKPLAHYPARELRGVWMSRFDYSQNLGTTQKEVIQEYIRKSFKTVKNAKNTKDG